MAKKLFIPSLLFAGWALTLSSTAYSATSNYVCAARIDCGAPRLPSTQDIPSNETPIVRGTSAKSAKEKCMSRYTNSYMRLARSLASRDSLFKETKSCEVLSEALPL